MNQKMCPRVRNTNRASSSAVPYLHSRVTSRLRPLDNYLISNSLLTYTFLENSQLGGKEWRGARERLVFAAYTKLYKATVRVYIEKMYDKH